MPQVNVKNALKPSAMLKSYLKTKGKAMTRTSEYPFDALTVGNYFVVSDHHQHARVAASEYGRKHGMVFSCRMQPDRTMRVYRCDGSQANVDKRGRQGKRVIPTTIKQPTKQEFFGWLNTFKPGQSFVMPSAYTDTFLLMQAWVELYSLKANVSMHSALQSDGTLLIARSS